MTQELKDTLNGVRAAQKIAEVRITNLFLDDYEEDRQIVEELVAYMKRKTEPEVNVIEEQINLLLQEGRK